MCSHCTLSLCCYNKPNPTTTYITPPVCPFCRSTIARLSVAKIKNIKDTDIREICRKSRKSKNFSEGSSSFKSLSVSFGKMGGGRNPGRIAADEDLVDKV
jgi:hypothetical protein